MEKLVCFSGVEAPDGFEDFGNYGVFWAIVDGELQQVKVKKWTDLRGSPGYSVWPGVYLCTFTEDGFISDVRVAEDIVTGYSVNAPRGGKIILGVEEREYRYRENAPVYWVENPTVIREYKTKIEYLKTDWNDNFFLKLDDDGVIEEMYIFKQQERARTHCWRI